MGECISLAFKFGQILSKNGLANIKSIREENIERENRKEINPKITIVLEKSANFDNLTKDIVLKSNWLSPQSITNCFIYDYSWFQPKRELKNGFWAKARHY